MKYIIALGFLFLLASCKEKETGCISSVVIDRRCDKIMDEARKRGKETKVCYQPKDSEELVFQKDRPRLDPDHEACKALREEALKKCEALPPPGPDDLQQISGTYMGRGKHPQSDFLEQYHRMIGFPTGRDRPVCPE